ncbi:serine/threonine protein kinase [Escherichia coli]|uniref:serine/threonine protein kinase n=1 Tax=Escherichia coli TaxID=562 RepID=UPI000C843792|nr:serine/threonine-protein kinase [Escherichia coli]
MVINEVRRIGSGGFGNVDLVQDVLSGKQFARKTFSINQAQPLPPDLAENVKKRFIREANVQYRLTHKNIVPVLFKDLNSNPPSFLMPVAASSLDKDIAQSRNLNGLFLRAIMDILSGLEELHTLQIYHRDLKPQNVLRFDSSEGPYYAISDFGLMSVKDTQISALTHTGMKMGSDYYTAPEIVSDLRKASIASDIYSLGCILHDFVGTDERIPCGEINNDSSAYAHILRVCTRRDPSRRFPSVAALRDAILSIDPSTVIHLSAEVGTYTTALDSDAGINVETWREIINFVEDNIGQENSKVIFQRLTLNRINEIIAHDTTLACRLGETYGRWVADGVFSFEQCDGICTRLEQFLQLHDLNCKAEIIIAMLLMGTSHNRWYVERRFMSVAGHDMTPELAKRLALEMSILEGRMCAAVSHLQRSIGATPDMLHPELFAMIQRVCH